MGIITKYAYQREMLLQRSGNKRLYEEEEGGRGDGMIQCTSHGEIETSSTQTWARLVRPPIYEPVADAKKRATKPLVEWL